MNEHPTRTKHLGLNRLTDDPAWPTKRQDLQAVVIIMQRHMAAGEPLRLLEDWGEADGDRLWVRFPAWIIDLAQHFQQRYGDCADAIVQRVLVELLPVEPLH